MAEALMYTFEGLDGAGKTTNIKALQTHFNEQGVPTVVCMSPSKSVLGQFIRGHFTDFDPWLKDSLFMLDMEHSLKAIPENVQLILWDRYVDSIYSSNRESRLEDVEKLAKSLPVPRRTFLLDIPPHVSWQREGAASDHQLDLDWLSMKYARYNELLQRYPGRFFRIDATLPLDLVRARIIDRITLDLSCVVNNRRNDLK